MEGAKEMRPLFSIIISCYNSSKTIERLLESLCKQELTKDELEIIISDDCSTEPYDDIVNEYKDKLNIKKVKTEYNWTKIAQDTHLSYQKAICNLLSKINSTNKPQVLSISWFPRP